MLSVSMISEGARHLICAQLLQANCSADNALFTTVCLRGTRKSTCSSTNSSRGDFFYLSAIFQHLYFRISVRDAHWSCTELCHDVHIAWPQFFCFVKFPVNWKTITDISILLRNEINNVLVTVFVPIQNIVVFFSFSVFGLFRHSDSDNSDT